MKNLRPNKGDKREIRQETVFTRAPRLEGRAKNAGNRSMRKPKKTGI